MKITYTKVRNPRWANMGRTLILCDVKFDHVKCESPFVASPDDIEDHGREIFTRCLNEEFGSVGKFSEGGATPSQVKQEKDIVPSAFPGWPQVTEFLNEANAENSRDTVRGIILVWASMIEELLGDIAEAFRIKHSISRKTIERKANSSLNSFSGRTKINFHFGLISEDELRACDHIRTIRNATAHTWNLSMTNQKFTEKALPAFNALYQEFSSDWLIYREDDLEFLVKLVFSGACGSLAFSLAQRKVEAVEQQLEQL